MKKKIIILSLLILALSTVPAFAYTENCTSTGGSCTTNNIIYNQFNYSNLFKYLNCNENCQNNISNLLKYYLKNCTSCNINQLDETTKNTQKSNNLNNIYTKPDTNYNNQNSNTTNNYTKPNTNYNNQNNTTNNYTKPNTNYNNQNSNTTNNYTKPDTNYNNQNNTTNKPNTNTNNNYSNVSTSISSYEKEVVTLVNKERAKAGLSPLTIDSSLSKAAKMKSKDMADNNYFSHTSPTYGNAGSLLKTLGIKYSAYAENIAAGQKTPSEVVLAWMNSSGHKANIMSASYTKIGVGYVTNSNGKAYWTQIFTD